MQVVLLPQRNWPGLQKVEGVVADTHPGEMLTSPTRGNLMLTPTPGKLMLTSPTRGRESDVEDAESQKSSVQGTFP